MGNAVTVLARDREPILFDGFEHCRHRNALAQRGSDPSAGEFPEKIGMKRWAEQVEGWSVRSGQASRYRHLGSEYGGKRSAQLFPKTEFAVWLSKACSCARRRSRTRMKLFASKCDAITEAALDRALEFFAPGVKECEVPGHRLASNDSHGSEWTQCSNIICSGPYTAPYRRFTSDELSATATSSFSTSGRLQRLLGDLTRTWVCGNVKPTAEMRDLHQKCYNALFNAGSKVCPGATECRSSSLRPTPTCWTVWAMAQGASSTQAKVWSLPGIDA